MQNIDTWVAGCKVRGFDWIDGNHLYFNIQYFNSGSSLSQAPALEKSVLMEKTPHNEKIIKEYLHSLINGIMFGGMEVKEVEQ